MGVEQRYVCQPDKSKWVEYKRVAESSARLPCAVQTDKQIYYAEASLSGCVSVATVEVPFFPTLPKEPTSQQVCGYENYKKLFSDFKESAVTDDIMQNAFLISSHDVCRNGRFSFTTDLLPGTGSEKWFSFIPHSEIPFRYDFSETPDHNFREKLINIAIHFGGVFPHLRLITTGV